jgi:hypothetical protein
MEHFLFHVLSVRVVSTAQITNVFLMRLHATFAIDQFSMGDAVNRPVVLGGTTFNAFRLSKNYTVNKILILKLVTSNMKYFSKYQHFFKKILIFLNLKK